MVEVMGKKIRISRGDTGIIGVRFTGDRALAADTVAVFSLKRNLKMDKPLWEKKTALENGDAVLRLTSADTDLRPGVYWWDLRLKLPDGGIQTPFEPQEFEVLEVVGDV